MACYEAGDIGARRELPPGDARRAELERHLLECDGCRAVVAELERLGRAVPLVFAAAAGQACPEPDAWLDLAAGRAEDSLATHLRQHLGACRDCAATAATLAAAPGVSGPAADPLASQAAATAHRLVAQPSSRFGRARTLEPRWMPGLALAASMAGLAVLVSWSLFLGTGPGSELTPPAVRSAPGAEPGLPLLLSPREGERLDRPGLVLRWRPVTGASRYIVTLLDARGETIWEGESSGTSLELAPAVRLVGAARYYAWVTAVLDDGRRARSPAVAFIAPGTMP